MKKKLIICLSFCVIALNLFSQENSSSTITSPSINQRDNNELRINIATSIIGFPELNYERFIEDNMGVGLAGSVSLEKTEDMSMRWYALPYYRLYFGKKKASGFFIEGNMALVGQKENYYESYFVNNTYVQGPLYTNSKTNFGFGGAIGVKLLARNGLTGEVYAGVGRLFGDYINDAYPRIGVCIGKRF
ncbi:hypothetical protein Palpr_2081 [Paludibacter propionicigenes WB4]|uniref:DUF3575 domain-containing protein n=1 Tax=Paludibacter propionicigenes (strain DSM 17365 / JCM 13257 / WB4) TaxID=694427 RepID=E4T674_PALPW|nr:hypothetical protein [Paludibacter propionicigenes]ADQ80218.1 hypothetical protein Palpr_2081 [Paludibacter propionicigenes WB4]